jgi:hypothetical protein
MRLLARSHIAMLLTVIYILIIMSPLTPIAMRSAVVVHAITGECVGNCAICGCSPEQSSNHTCCCWKKMKQYHHKHADDPSADCCKNKQSSSNPILRCGCPCGDNKLLALWEIDDFDLLPYRFSETTLALHEDDPSFLDPHRFKDRPGDPPEPPPKLTILS